MSEKKESKIEKVNQSLKNINQMIDKELSKLRDLSEEDIKVLLGQAKMQMEEKRKEFLRMRLNSLTVAELEKIIKQSDKHAGTNKRETIYRDENLQLVLDGDAYNQAIDEIHDTAKEILEMKKEILEKSENIVKDFKFKKYGGS